MTLHEILKMGDPRLLRVAQPVERFATPELRTLVADMFETMRSVNGAGLAAPQIGVDLQLVIFGFKRNERYPDAPAVPETVLLNPVIEPLDDVEEEGWEGCLSVPGLRGVVPRWARIRYRGVDVDGLPIDREAEGFHARVVQHECDHLRGILYPMRVRDFGRFGYTSVLFPTWIPPPTTDCALAARAPLVRSPCKGTCRARRPVGTASATSVDDIDDRDAPARGRIEAETTMTTSNGRTSAQASTRWGWGRLDAMLVLAAFLGLGVLPAKAQTASGGDPPSRVARLSDVAGQVWIYNDETAEWQTVERNRPLTTGDRIATDSGARAEITLGSTTLRLDAATEILVAQLDDRRYVVQLATGSVAARLRSPQALSEFELDTDEGHFRVQTVGRYRFDRFEQTSEVTVFNGQAAYEAKTTGLPVYTGQHAQFWIDAAGAPQYAMIAPARDAFASWNDERDRNEDRIVATGDRFVSPEMTGAEDLGRYGQWQQTPDYGPVWIPTSVPADWAPYSAGHWAFVRPWGWTWVDDAPWGFAPFHYGRWVYQRNAWCWAPGTYVARPVYAPALVAWIGGPRVGVSISIGGGGPPVGWVPLAPREVYVPSYRASPRYVQQVNITHVTNITNITTIVENRNGAADRRDFANRRFPHAVTFVPSDVMTRRQPVGPAAARYRNDPQVRALVADPRPAPSLNAPPVAAPVVPSRPSTGGPAPRPPFEGRDRGGFAGRPDAGRPGDRPGERPGMQPGTQPTPVGPVATPRPIGAPSTVVGPATSPAPVGAPATAVGPVTSPQPVGAPQGTAPRNDRFGRGGAPIEGGPGRGGREGAAPAEQARPPVAQPPMQSAPQLQQQPQQQPQQPQQQAQPQPQRMTIPTPIQRATQANDVGRVAPALRGREGAAVEPRAAAPIAVPQAVAPAPPIAAPQAQQPPQQEMRRPERIAPPRPVEAPEAAEVARPAPQVAEPRPVESARPATAEQRTNRPEAPRPREERRDDKRDDKPDRR